ncbi:hypothetical protein PITC_078330 [Penicillium italicum]|uniref:Uncharacterized protein n=1 Tax=Penicillium italicum TaxID=40296 RepID=A0A0A2KPX9_PENIT|nr:hypothetical protein PITC_078330 [Penicillium italicum]
MLHDVPKPMLRGNVLRGIALVFGEGNIRQVLSIVNMLPRKEDTRRVDFFIPVVTALTYAVSIGHTNEKLPLAEPPVVLRSITQQDRAFHKPMAKIGEAPCYSIIL